MLRTQDTMYNDRHYQFEYGVRFMNGRSKFNCSVTCHTLIQVINGNDFIIAKSECCV